MSGRGLASCTRRARPVHVQLLHPARRFAHTSPPPLVGARHSVPSRARHHPPRIQRYPPLLAQHSSSSYAAEPDTSNFIETITDEPEPDFRARPTAPPRVIDPSEREFHHRKPRQHIDPPTDDAEVVRYFTQLFPPLVFPENVALRMITHTSWFSGAQGHNGRFVFLGRRALRASMLLFLQSNEVHKPVSKFDVPPWDGDISETVHKALDTYVLGQEVGRVWKLEQVMRWVPVMPDSTETERMLYSSGLFKVRGATVESVMGGLLHQFGAVIAQRAFQTRVLPHISHRLPQPYQRVAAELAERMGTRTPLLAVPPPPLPQIPENPVHTTAQSQVMESAMPGVRLQQQSQPTPKAKPQRRTVERVPIAK